MKMPIKKHFDYIPLILLIAACCVTYFVLIQAASGPLVLDDMKVLSVLAIPTAELVSELVPDGRDNLGFGRIVSYLSYFVDGQVWPPDVFSLKRTGILLHITNALLLAWFLKLFLEQVCWRINPSVGLLVASFWVIHPLWISTNLYVAQRSVLLASFFLLSALIIYLKFSLLRQSTTRTILTLGAVFFVLLLSVLSKEIGVVGLIYLLMVDYFISHRKERLEGLSICLRIVLGVIFLVALSYLIYRIQAVSGVYIRRDFSLSERLMTESRVLWEYIFNVLFPSVENISLMRDDYQISRGVFSPLTTASSLIGHCLLICCVWLLRRKMPFLVFGVFWFYTGHLLEGTIIPLELYYDYRNYLPGIGLIFAIICAIDRFANGRKLWVGLLAPFFLYYSLQLKAYADDWSEEERLYRSWNQKYPGSMRAKLTLANLQLNRGNYQDANSILAEAVMLNPLHLPVRLRRVQLNCHSPQILSELHLISEQLYKMPFQYGSLSALSDLVDMSSKEYCYSDMLQGLSRLTNDLIKDPRFSEYPKDLGYLQQLKDRIDKQYKQEF